MTTDAEAWAQATEAALLAAAIPLVPAHGWTWRTARLAGATLKMSAGDVELLVPHGPADLAALFSRAHDARALAALAGVEPAALKIRARIRTGVEARLEAAMVDAAATRRWTGFLALPGNLTLGARLAWESADAIWRWAGDTATDENHYTKRALLSGILTGGLAVRLASGPGEAMAFVDRRIENVMAFEVWKAKTTFRPSVFAELLARSLSRARYGDTPAE
jgi:ubiquinone biosynthesis protein COQ9